MFLWIKKGERGRGLQYWFWIKKVGDLCLSFYLSIGCITAYSAMKNGKLSMMQPLLRNSWHSESNRKEGKKPSAGWLELVYIWVCPSKMRRHRREITPSNSSPSFLAQLSLKRLHINNTALRVSRDSGNKRMTTIVWHTLREGLFSPVPGNICCSSAVSLQSLDPVRKKYKNSTHIAVHHVSAYKEIRVHRFALFGGGQR